MTQAEISAIMDKYETAAPVAAKDRKAFDQRVRTRVSSEPRVEAQKESLGEMHLKTNQARRKLAQLIRDYDGSVIKFADLLKGDGMTRPEAMLYGVLKLIPLEMAENKVEEMEDEAILERGNSMEKLVGSMSKILNDHYNEIQDLKRVGEATKTEILGHMEFLDKEVVRHLSSGTGSETRTAELQADLAILQGELATLETKLSEYQTNLIEARNDGDLEKVNELAAEMNAIHDLRHDLIRGDRHLKGLESQITREYLTAADGVQSANSSLNASWANYEQAELFIDSLHEVEVKYHHVLKYVLPVFEQQAKLSDGGVSLLQMQEALLKTVEISQELMGANIDLFESLANQTTELIKAEMYDTETMKGYRARAVEIRNNLRDEKLDWADKVTNVDTVIQDSKVEIPEYTQRQ